jgi:hypothetical protein
MWRPVCIAAVVALRWSGGAHDEYFYTIAARSALQLK